jgi:outer membrane biosynthesis protein TonB
MIELRLTLDISDALKEALTEITRSLHRVEVTTAPAVISEPIHVEAIIDEAPKPEAKPAKKTKAAKKAEPAPEPVKPEEKAEVIDPPPSQSSTRSVEQNPAQPEGQGIGDAEQAPKAQNDDADDETGKGETGQIIADLTGKLIARMNEENRDRGTINKNLRKKCEEIGLQFPTVPALIQAIGYGPAYRACIGEA